MTMWAHQKRDPESLCPSVKYVSPNSLVFHTQCDRSLARSSWYAWFATNNQSVSFEDCMGECSVSRTLCYAVAYHASTKDCLFFNDTSIIGEGLGEWTYDVALANKEQLEEPKDISCPFKDHPEYTTENGLDFDIVCNRDLGGYGGDYCADNYSYEDWKCYAHADTMRECLEMCSQAHPLCKGVAWNPDMSSGFGNCYFKSHPEEATDLPFTEITHSARVTSSLYNIDRRCKNDDSYSTGKQPDQYSVSCFQTRTGSQNITTSHAYSLDDCLNDCSGASGCRGVVFDLSLSYGYENCYLQNFTGQANTGANATFALRLSDDTRADSGSASKAWIAGPVIGIAVLLTLLVAFGLYWRKRKARKNATKPEGVGRRIIYEEREKRLVYEVGPGAHGPYERRYEMRDPNSENMFQHEMPRSP